MAKNRKPIIPPSLQPRKKTKKEIPGSQKTEKSTPKSEPEATPTSNPASPPPVEKAVKKEVVASSPTPPAKTEKKRFTLWLEGKTFQAFKVHVAMSGGSASDYIEKLIKKDLNLD